MDILKLYIPIAPFLGKILLELFQRDVVTGNFGPVGELLVTETEHNSSEIVLLRFLQGRLIRLNIRLALRRGLVRLFRSVKMPLLATGARPILLH